MGDLVNAFFEAVGAVLCWVNFYSLVRDRDVKGVFWPATVFWAAWGAWNLWYYPSLGQWLSFYAGVVLCAGNFAWVMGLAVLRFRAWRSPSIHDRDTLPEIEPPPASSDTLRSIPIPWIADAETPVGQRVIDAVEWAAPVDVTALDTSARGVVVRYRPHANALLTADDLAAMVASARRVLPAKLVVELTPEKPHALAT